ncbi:MULTISPECIES: cell division protein ZapA [Weeksella]|uniref:Cell division protein ZapA n=1 Tax=Weeksella virosa (strain ATCC 43766 / DSM 16922 / JCM 21250 / CCUG 30538 / CDC 9751 / IAM 14551 / NBRC 16016 / NCTC 11634 / CL345/78) TaxID=865938 RepID=F0P0Y9_WEEVC|nr:MULTISPECIES: cell division protein ZapA [Weeksella]ADX68573.1 hypothetical protein Weevi_1886 [Weeksella virosa DSM 16922]MDK7375212.1 cell division protein ZapA [Weeksella virosa]MDK7675255.1 cell division protein ZapA [Weeksella virosa]OFM85706.1 hypothetical protein HMPREF2660_06575 [Weeksella sp. HMSC059D05]SUP54910.1 Cell division protein ZapA [Weeksella virosa]
MSTQRIKLTISGRQYPLTILLEDEEIARLAAKEINDTLKLFEEEYAVSDKQDGLAMALIQYAIKDFKTRREAKNVEAIPHHRIDELVERIDETLANK